MQPSDESLVDAAKAGDREAFTRLIRRWDARVLNLAYRLTGDPEDAQDLRQAAFFRAYSALSRFSGDALFSTWLYRIVVNLCRDRARSRQAHMRTIGLPSDQAAVADLPEPTCTGSERRDELRAVVAAAVSSLPDREREVVVLRHFQEQTFREIAEILETPVATVKSRTLTALQRLRAEFERLKLSCEP